MKKIFFMFISALLAGIPVFGQEPQQGDRRDSLDATVYTARQGGNYLMKGREIRTEAISQAGLCKMACCSLAESFENSASVTVGYSDAVTGARQIRLLGLSGIYTQMLDENRPVMRGLSAPWGLSYIPGQWLESIQIAKGATSVTNGVESITGQINMEHRKPTDEKPLFLNASIMSNTQMDLNVASSLQLDDRWSTVILGHISDNQRSMDGNNDGFIDSPLATQLNIANRWLYYAPSGMQVRFGVRALQDKRHGGMESPYNKGLTAYGYERYKEGSDAFWGSDILNRSFNAYAKVGVPLNEDNTRNVAAVADYTYQYMDSWFGATTFKARQNSAFLNVLYQDQMTDDDKLVLGWGGLLDGYTDFLDRYLLYDQSTAVSNDKSRWYNAGFFGEYTHHVGDKFSMIMGLRGDWYGRDCGCVVTPRLTFKYNPIENLTLRGNAGRGVRRSFTFVDNIGIFSTSKTFIGDFTDHVLEDAWISGCNATYYLKNLGVTEDAYVSLDFFSTSFSEQKIIDYDYTNLALVAYNLTDVEDGRAFSNTIQADFSFDPVENLNVNATFRYTDARQSYLKRSLVEKPMTSRFKGVLNCQYKTNLSKWIFDFTASINGPCKVYDFMKDQTDSDGNLLYKNGLSPVYPLLYAQVTRRLKGIDLYIGGENLTNFRQKYAIYGTASEDGTINTNLPNFDASCVWGPLMGIEVYGGLRFTLWK